MKAPAEHAQPGQTLFFFGVRNFEDARAEFVSRFEFRRKISKSLKQSIDSFKLERRTEKAREGFALLDQG